MQKRIMLFMGVPYEGVPYKLYWVYYSGARARTGFYFCCRTRLCFGRTPDANLCLLLLFFFGVIIIRHSCVLCLGVGKGCSIRESVLLTRCFEISTFPAFKRCVHESAGEVLGGFHIWRTENLWSFSSIGPNLSSIGLQITGVSFP